MKQWTFFVCALVSLLWLAGCETVKGVGRDITDASSSVQKAISRK